MKEGKGCGESQGISAGGSKAGKGLVSVLGSLWVLRSLCSLHNGHIGYSMYALIVVLVFLLFGISKII